MCAIIHAVNELEEKEEEKEKQLPSCSRRGVASPSPPFIHTFIDRFCNDSLESANLLRQLLGMPYRHGL